MADVYRNVQITLAAGVSDDDDGGIFKSVDKEHVGPNYVTITDEGEEHQVYMRSAICHSEMLPLAERGWIFQERLLCRRYLIFARDELQWECLEDVACSCQHSTSQNSVFNPREEGRDPYFPNTDSINSDKFTKAKLAKLDELANEDLGDLWQLLITEYSLRKLTFPKYKLPALASMARVFEGVSGDKYVEGLWLSKLHNDLIWERDPEFSESLGRPRFNVPS